VTRISAILFVAVLVGAPTTGVRADISGINISPLRLRIGLGERATTVDLINQQTVSDLLRVQGYAWSQDDSGADKLEPTEDILVVPPIMSFDPNQHRIVRIGLRHTVTQAAEQAFRIVMTEVRVAPEHSPGLHFKLQISVPLFVAGTERPKFSADWSARISANEKVAVVVKNTGNVHLRLTGLRVYADSSLQKLVCDEHNQSYVLAGLSRPFELGCGRALTLPSVVAEGFANNRAFKVIVPVART
jgi:fimbrial chaperone protein